MEDKMAGRMKGKIANDTLTIAGYVNVPGRESRPLNSRGRGKFIEVIEQRAFQKAIDAAKKIKLLLDHRKDRELADTETGTLTLYEDSVGLRAEARINDKEVIDAARDGKLKGWSFNMRAIKDSIENRAEDLLPIRRITEFLMDEVSIIKDKTPCYSSMSIEVRAGEEVEEEMRGIELDFHIYDEDGSTHVHADGKDAKDIIGKDGTAALNAAFRNRAERTRIT
jgi:HK97 family phage prohead protease